MASQYRNSRAENKYQVSRKKKPDTLKDDNSVKSTLVSRNIKILGKRTSVRLEPEMWTALYDIADRENCSIHDICSLVSMRKKQKTSMTAAIRVFLMLYFKAASTEKGHEKAGHGSFSQMIRRARMTAEEYDALKDCDFMDRHGPRTSWSGAR